MDPEGQTNDKSIQHIQHYLEICHNATLKSYSKDGFIGGREILKREARNIEDVLSTCTTRNNQVSKILMTSDLFQSSCRFFFNTANDGVISEEILIKFVQTCSKLAEKHGKIRKKIDFDCILVDHEGRKSWLSDGYFEKMEKVIDEYDRSEFPDDEPLLKAHFKYQLGRYYFNKSKDENEQPNRQREYFEKAANNIEESRNLRKQNMERENSSPLTKVDVILSLLMLGHLRKYQSTQRHQVESFNELMAMAKDCCGKATALVDELLGKHPLKVDCHKVLGDLLLEMKQIKAARKNYEIALNVFEELKLTPNIGKVYLLKNYATSLTKLQKYERGKEMFQRAKDYYKKAIALVDEFLGKHSLKVDCHKVLGDLLLEMKENESARENYEIALNVFEELELTKGKKVNLLKNYATSLMKLQEYDRGEEMIQKAIALVDEFLGKHSLKVDCHEVLGDLLLEMKENESARENYKIALNVFEELELPPNKGKVYLLKKYATTLMKLQKYERGNEMFQRASEINTEYELGLEDMIETTRQQYN
ncbi:uncharacterized protein LOC124447856 isoform X2 [Xenia sp. Carnegie-2017]|uniref:uncharacterized protein LOC124447856 isoform X2 n=1 Tax=Xenia sp. Carnegie-2017 TaxID=2897299 RepID=UPI001F0429CE|nr:uncharacterized protein LOC124447856 isoform X2 [Xenia sp. Carnegie-2017]XP_046854805.1 uncharacterized protein LOC124447856 isoform X2 [Xenia sp. Carnegie-2017]XP_046854806.1 uncharacterized protein LOC124447856 isoform X2 [Xenia sp. Carnegie-2017]XP_046854807.1 uncharacterized protein LOC124447856 isoform X2 [Xenia sp. Carnegie-2017]